MSPQSLRSVVQYLKGLDLPADKQEIIDCAVRNHAPQDVVDLLQQLPNERYEGMDDVWRAIGEKL